jgi:hypothetical protein
MSYYIYKICCDDCPEYVYVGSTKAFRERKYRHKQDCKTKDYKLYNIIRENGGWDNWRMVILEECGEITFTEARIKEEEHRVKLNANLNSQKCYTNEEEKKIQHNKVANEWSKNNKEKVLETNKTYREKNKDIIKEKKNIKFMCECGGTYTNANKSRHEQTKIHKKLIEEKNNI